MMDNIRFFGLNFTLKDNSYQFSTAKHSFIDEVHGLDIKPGRGAKNNIQINLLHFTTTKGVTFRFSCSSEVTFQPQRRRGLRDFIATPLKVSSKNKALFELNIESPQKLSSGLIVNLGPLQLGESACKLVLSTGGDGLRDFWVQTQRTHDLLDAQDAPLSIDCNRRSLLRVYHSSSSKNLALQAKQNPFTLTTHVGQDANLDKRWQASRLNLDVDDLQQSLTLSFREDRRDKALLPLHPFSKNINGETHTLPSMAVDAQSLEITATRSRQVSRVMHITDITAIPKAEAYLHTYALVMNALNNMSSNITHHCWRVTKRLPLALRVEDHDGLPKGLLLRYQRTSTALLKKSANAEILGLRREVKLDCETDVALKFDNSIFYRKRFDQFSRSLVRIVTTPYLEVEATSLQINRPGIALKQPQRDDITSWQFIKPGETPHTVKFPVCPDEAMTSGDGNVIDRFLRNCNASYSGLDSDNLTVTHESGLNIQGNLREGQQQSRPGLNSLFTSINDENDEGVLTPATLAPPALGTHQNRFSFGSYEFAHEWEVGEIPEYIPLLADENGVLSAGLRGELLNEFPMDPEYSSGDQNIAITELTTHQGLDRNNNDGHLVGIIKLGKEDDLFTILRKEQVTASEITNNDDGGLTKLLPEKLQQKAWTGLILFEQVLDLSSFPLLGSLFPENFNLNLRYLAVSAEQQGKFSTYGSVNWQNPELNNPHNRPDDDKKSELRVQMAKVELTWAARKLTTFMTETRIDYLSFAGGRKPQRNGSPDLTRVDIIGSIDRNTKEIRFLAQANKPIPLFDEDGDGIGPLKQAYIQKVEITRTNGKTDFNVDGDVELQEYDLGSLWSFENGDKLRSDGLKFGFQDNLGLSGDWFEFDYPSLRFDFAKGWNLLDLDDVAVDLIRIGFDSSANDFDWNSLLPVLDGDDWDAPAMRLGLELNLGKLPLLSSDSLKDLIFDFELSLPFGKDRNGDTDYLSIDIENCRLSVQALGFDKLNLKLMRFLEISADNLQLESKNNILWLFLQGLKLKILNKTLIEDFTLGHYWGDQQTGFIGLLNDQFPTLPLIDIDWLLIGRNLLLNGNNNNDLLKAIVSVDPNPRPLKQEIREAFEQNALIPSGNANNIGEWVFAAGFNMFQGFLAGKLLFHDDVYYGLALDGPFLREWFGYDLGISILYIKQESTEEDIFRLSLRVPSISLGGIAFNGGVVAFEIQMNGGFMVDIGFPWLTDAGERYWERGFGVMLGGVMGRGGCYLAKRSNVRSGNVAEGERQGKVTLVEGGYAAMVGFGGEYRSGPLNVSAYAGVYFSCEGGILFFSPLDRPQSLELVGLRLSGAIGIQARGIAELNWWIISIRVEVVAGAEARLTVFWGALEDYQPGTPNLPAITNNQNARVGVSVDFVLYARVDARACIGKGIFKVCKSISVGVSMPYRTTLYLS